MTERPWTIDAGVARDLSEALGWEPDDGAAALAMRFPERIPMGSTAKLAAIAAGEVPPGADPDDLARRLLAHQLDRASAHDGGAPSPAWSCWVVGTVFAALVEGAGGGPAEVAVIRRTDDRSPTVDFHAAVLVPGDGRTTWICDPYFGVAVALPAEPGARGEHDSLLAEAVVRREGDRGWTFDVRLRRWDGGLSYRLLGPALDRGDVHALAAVSATYSGVPSRPYVRLHVGDTVVDASEAEDGTAPLRRWSPAEGPVDTVLPAWPDAAEAFAARTGTRPI